VAHRTATYYNSLIKQNCRVSILSTELKSTVDFRFHTYNMLALLTILKKVLFIKMVIDYFLPHILIYIQCYRN